MGVSSEWYTHIDLIRGTSNLKIAVMGVKRVADEVIFAAYLALHGVSCYDGVVGIEHGEWIEEVADCLQCLKNDKDLAHVQPIH